MMKNGEKRIQDQGPQARKFISVSDIVKVVILVVVGLGSGAGYNAFAPTNTNLNLRVRSIEERTNRHNGDIIECRERIRADTEMLQVYIEAHDDEQELRQKLVDQEIVYIREILLEIKQDVKDIKNGH